MGNSITVTFNYHTFLTKENFVDDLLKHLDYYILIKVKYWLVKLINKNQTLYTDSNFKYRIFFG